MQEQLDRIEAKLDLLLDNAGKEASKEYSDQDMAEAIAYSKETGEIWPDWYADLYSIPGFKWSLEHCQAWLTENGITKARANEAAAALKGKWGGKGWKNTDVWATFRAWALRPQQGVSTVKPDLIRERMLAEVAAYDFEGAAEARRARSEHERELREAEERQ